VAGRGPGWSAGLPARGPLTPSRCWARAPPSWSLCPLRADQSEQRRVPTCADHRDVFNPLLNVGLPFLGIRSSCRRWSPRADRLRGPSGSRRSAAGERAPRSSLWLALGVGRGGCSSTSPACARARAGDRRPFVEFERSTTISDHEDILVVDINHSRFMLDPQTHLNERLTRRAAVAVRLREGGGAGLSHRRWERRPSRRRDSPLVQLPGRCCPLELVPLAGDPRLGGRGSWTGSRSRSSTRPARCSITRRRCHLTSARSATSHPLPPRRGRLGARLRPHLQTGSARRTIFPRHADHLPARQRQISGLSFSLGFMLLVRLIAATGIGGE